MNNFVVILAAGKGTRMKSDLPKVLHTLNEKAMLHYVLDAVNHINIKKVVIVIGYEKEKVKSSVNLWAKSANPDFELEFIEQPHMRGTGEAVMLTESAFRGETGRLLILLGDVPGIQKSTIKRLMNTGIQDSDIPFVVSMEVENPFGYGRILRLKDYSVLGIREEKDTTDEEKKIKEVNTGIFSFPIPEIWHNLQQIQNNNNQKEYYLTDIIEIYREKGLPFHAIKEENAHEFSGINSKEQLQKMENETN